MRCICLEEIPFLLAAIRCEASTHLCSGILERSNTVPTVTVYCSRQSLHWIEAGAMRLAVQLRGLEEPQCGQNGPSGQSCSSR